MIRRSIVINMDRNERRLGGFMKQYSKSDMSNTRLQRLVGIDARARWQEIWRTVDISARIFLASMDNRKRHEQLPSRGAVGCYLSHLAAYESVRKHDDVVMILEDDANIPHDLKARAERTLSLVPDDWDVVLMRYRTPGWNPKYPVSPRRIGSFVGLQTYIVSPLGAKKILTDDHTFPIDRQIDGVLSAMARRGKLNVYGAGYNCRMPQPGLFAAASTTVQKITVRELLFPFLSWDSTLHQDADKHTSRQVYQNIRTVIQDLGLPKYHP